MANITVKSTSTTALSFAFHGGERDYLPPEKTDVVVVNGVAPVPPSDLDFDTEQNIEDGSAWYNLRAAIVDADDILSNLSERHPPSVKDRFRLKVALDRLKKGAETLENHMARAGLWVSQDEWDDNDNRNTWHWF